VTGLCLDHTATLLTRTMRHCHVDLRSRVQPVYTLPLYTLFRYCGPGVTTVQYLLTLEQICYFVVKFML